MFFAILFSIYLGILFLGFLVWTDHNHHWVQKTRSFAWDLLNPTNKALWILDKSPLLSAILVFFAVISTATYLVKGSDLSFLVDSATLFR